MVSRDRKEFIASARFTRQDLMLASAVGPVDPYIRAVDPYIQAEVKRDLLIEKERAYAESIVGRPVRAVVAHAGVDPVTSSAFVSASALVCFEVEGGYYWHPDSARPWTYNIDDPA